MLIQPIGKPQPAFGYKHALKDAFNKGLLPKDLKGLYGVKLTKKNVSLEHGIPVSKGGKTTWDNLFLADKERNNARGTKPIFSVITKEKMVEHLKQFIDVDNYLMNGKKYIKGICKKFKLNEKDVYDV